MLLRVREAAHGLWTGVDTREIARTSRMVSRITGYQVQPNKAIVGRNAFAHESGIHQDGVLKERTTYEIMDATTIGLETNSLVLGKHSGRHALRNALEELGFQVEGAALNTAFKRFKELADKKKKVTALDLEAIVSDEMKQAPAAFELESFDIEASSTRSPLARVRVRMPDGEVESGSFTGDGPVDAFFSALNAAIGPRGAAEGVPRVRGHGRARRARRGHRAARAGRAPVARAWACRPTSSRRPARPTCARSRTRSRTTRSAEAERVLEQEAKQDAHALTAWPDPFTWRRRRAADPLRRGAAAPRRPALLADARLRGVTSLLTTERARRRRRRRSPTRAARCCTCRPGAWTRSRPSCSPRAGERPARGARRRPGDRHGEGDRGRDAGSRVRRDPDHAVGRRAHPLPPHAEGRRGRAPGAALARGRRPGADGLAAAAGARRERDERRWPTPWRRSTRRSPTRWPSCRRCAAPSCSPRGVRGRARRPRRGRARRAARGRTRRRSTGFAVHHATCQTIVRTAGTPHAETNAVMLPHFAGLMAERGARRSSARLARALGALGGDPQAAAEHRASSPRAAATRGCPSSAWTTTTCPRSPPRSSGTRRSATRPRRRTRPSCSGSCARRSDTGRCVSAPLGAGAPEHRATLPSEHQAPLAADDEPADVHLTPSTGPSPSAGWRVGSGARTRRATAARARTRCVRLAVDVEAAAAEAVADRADRSRSTWLLTRQTRFEACPGLPRPRARPRSVPAERCRARTGSPSSGLPASRDRRRWSDPHAAVVDAGRVRRAQRRRGRGCSDEPADVRVLQAAAACPTMSIAVDQERAVRSTVLLCAPEGRSTWWAC